MGWGVLAIALLALAACNFDGDDGSSSGGGSSTPADAGGHTLTADPSGGLGYTSSADGSAYYVYTEAGLLAWAEAVQKAIDDGASEVGISCTLYNCIDMSGQGEWTPICNYFIPYAGAFDGGGHAVSSLAVGTVTKDNYTFAGFFGGIGSGDQVQDLGVSIASFTSADYAGGIAGWSNGGTYTACYWSCTVKGVQDTNGEEVTGNDWSSAMSAMNSALSGEGWQYEKNGNSTTEPLTLKKS